MGAWCNYDRESETHEGWLGFFWSHPKTLKRKREPSNSSQQPTTCRLSARRFRGSFGATLCLAALAREGTWRLSERTLCASPVRATLSIPGG
jgi:hypothetical protein